jgi:hypothetical protein
MSHINELNLIISPKFSYELYGILAPERKED